MDFGSRRWNSCELPLKAFTQLFQNIVFPCRMNNDLRPSSPSIGPRCAFALMAKAPVAGAVKTRLTPPLTPEEAAKLSMCFLRDMTTNVTTLCGNSNYLAGLIAKGLAIQIPGRPDIS